MSIKFIARTISAALSLSAIYGVSIIMTPTMAPIDGDFSLPNYAPEQNPMDDISCTAYKVPVEGPTPSMDKRPKTVNASRRDQPFKYTI